MITGKLEIDGSGSPHSMYMSKYMSGNGYGNDQHHCFYFFCLEGDGYASGHRDADEQFILTHGDGYGFGTNYGHTDGDGNTGNSDGRGDGDDSEYPSEA